MTNFTLSQLERLERLINDRQDVLRELRLDLNNRLLAGHTTQSEINTYANYVSELETLRIMEDMINEQKEAMSS